MRELECRSSCLYYVLLDRLKYTKNRSQEFKYSLRNNERPHLKLENRNNNNNVTMRILKHNCSSDG